MNRCCSILHHRKGWAQLFAERGHRVVLFEREAVLGGQVELLARTRNRAELARLTDWYRHELQRLQVEVRLGVDFDDAMLGEFAGASVIVATGARSVRVSGIAAGDIPVLDGLAVLRNDKTLKGVGKALLIDRDHYYGAPSLAHHLRDNGIDVTLITENPMIGLDLPPGALPGALRRLVEASVRILPLTRIVSGQGGTVRVKNLLSGEQSDLEGIELIVVAGERAAVDERYAALAEVDETVQLVGDAMAPRQIWQAVREGFLAGHRI